jgi:CRP/FNR family transcriptional regulator, anaerobic regulatory protein
MANHLKKTNTVSCSVCPVRQLSMYQAIPEIQLDIVQQYRAEQRTVSAKNHLYHQGEKHPNTYTLFSGWVMLYKTLSNGGRQVLRYALPGDFLSFQPDMVGPVNHSAQALTDCTVCVFPRQSLLEMLHKHPELAMRIAWITARDMALGHEYLVSIGRKNARERLAFLFLELFHRMRMHVPSLGNTIPFPMTQEDVADTIGLTLVHVNRTLRSLRQEGLVKLAHHSLTILDYAALSELAGYNAENLVNQPLL